MTTPVHSHNSFEVQGANVKIEDEFITSDYVYRSTKVSENGRGGITVEPTETRYSFKTDRRVPKTGVLLVGIAGNNGTTVLGGILANKHGLAWNTKDGVQQPNYYGSLSQSTTTFLGCNQNRQIFVPLKSVLPMVDPSDLVIDGWDINGATLDVAMQRACVFDYGLQQKLAPYLSQRQPMKSIYYPDFIASNQSERADHVYDGDRACAQHLAWLRRDICNFKAKHSLDQVIVVWTANTERYSEVIAGVHDTVEHFLQAIENEHTEVAPSQMFAAAAILEGCAFLNGSPQNTFCPALIALARARGVFIGGDDFKSGQTKIKSVLADFLVSSGIKPEAIVSYNHLGNNDGKNLDEHKQFRSKEISKSDVVNDIVQSNQILYAHDERPDHCVVIKYVPTVKDSKRALDEYTSRIFMNGSNTIVLHNTCEDSLLAAPIIIDLVVFTELFQRIEWKTCADDDSSAFQPFDSILTVLSFLLKAPLVPKDAPMVNALFKQKACIENILRACIGLPPINDMLLEYKTKSFK
eukprot:CAMPEP_0202710328 /NCGR_PEP_ID=MMETSP1385-20130828/22321_1 /ASSEMBLY_ACC=CAM_ASM_000861 /TAXON_ID=933848 /ORGANISM="Elphidium margaritaceum" /LENGTH=522 /DNA_ID=CAMNT_0049369845 /DNA_START=46 /DNA_END=1614 /DNA_ORIENTATION=+